MRSRLLSSSFGPEESLNSLKMDQKCKLEPISSNVINDHKIFELVLLALFEELKSHYHKLRIEIQWTKIMTEYVPSRDFLLSGSKIIPRVLLV